MLTYDYVCPANDRTVQVQHGIKDRLKTWGELCERAGLDPAETPLDTPVERLMSGGLLATVSGATRGEMPPLPMAGGGCCGQPQSCHRHAH